MGLRLLSVSCAAILIVPARLISTTALTATCTHDTTTRTVSVVAQGALTFVEVTESNITINGVVCQSAAVTNTDTINIAGSESSEVVAVLAESGSFAPGATDEGDGTSEIEFFVDMLGGNEDILVVGGSAQADILTSGTNGVNLNDDFDSDMTVGGHEFLQLIGLGGNDTLSAGGGRGTGGPNSATAISGDAGGDVLSGGSDDDYLEGGAGNDRIRGMLGADELVGGRGNDRLSGGAGQDLLSGNQGRDVLRGGPGRDRMNGGDGTDTCYPGRGGGKEVSCERPISGLDGRV